MSRNGNRWFTFGRVVPLADGKIVAIPAGTEYECIAWSRTKEAAIEKRNKLDRQGRQGINVFAASRANAIRDICKVYEGITVKGYLSPEARKAGREMIRAAVVRQIFCPYTKVVLDMRRAVLVGTGTRWFIMAAPFWDERREQVMAVQAQAGRETQVYDGREYFKRG